ncbi:hypothetical protein CC1G_09701 [Coprinopsis cinerea okayama7|uniref:Polyketide cyclase/dehydrase n=1 Tax=Coprinopsis cinerea (strain Okayama-7 / 130 / ATCC MYA-4618 / FGSC 9003) TaxID=240176 RepID=A8NJD7_COPC7|nr:hypothetical protein CC1G_09701 [Coprinopsis cinerea okayama7\|eukprot:XP_001834201.2 hypothetical protein CC1G_09701 [Coprinopsis cinerea okayama7\
MALPPGLPPLDSGVFGVSASSIINAPPQHVWNVLTDFQSGLEESVRNVADEQGNPLPDSALAEGVFLNISEVHIPPTMGDPGPFGKSSAFERVNTVDTVNYRLSWEYWGKTPSWILHAERWQVLIDLGDGQTKYYTQEVFKGGLAYVVKGMHEKGLNEGFQAMADTLKARAEETS